MGRTYTASTCRWAVSTLVLAPPLWLDAGEFPWTCTRTPPDRQLETTDICADCPHWMPHDPSAPFTERKLDG